MKKIVNILLVVLYLPVLFVFFSFNEKEKSEYLMYRKALKCPYTGAVGFIWIFRKFPEYRNVLYKRMGRLALPLSLVYKKERTFGRFFLDEKSIFIYNSTKSYYYIERRQR